jgi:hypothetical protein
LQKLRQNEPDVIILLYFSNWLRAIRTNHLYPGVTALAAGHSSCRLEKYNSPYLSHLETLAICTGLVRLCLKIEQLDTPAIRTGEWFTSIRTFWLSAQGAPAKASRQASRQSSYPHWRTWYKEILSFQRLNTLAIRTVPPGQGQKPSIWTLHLSALEVPPATGHSGYLHKMPWLGHSSK